MTGIMIEGKWTANWNARAQKGAYNPTPTTFRNHVSADGSSGFKAETGRYHLYASLACPWAHRTLIMRELKGLNQVISVSIADPILGDQGWIFSNAPEDIPDEDIPDSVNHSQYLREIYLKADSRYTGRVTVPVLWDKQRQTIINNESLEIMRMFDVEFAELATQKVDLYPHELRPEIDQTISAISQSISTGVYRAGFTTSQGIYEEAVTELFEQLDRWEKVLDQQRYLCGAQLTEADICLFTTLYRFDSVYYSHFKCNLRRIIDYPNLWNYLKDLYQRPEFKATCNMDYIKRGYYKSMVEINPNQIVPKGPILDFDAPHNRHNLLPAKGASIRYGQWSQAQKV
jgi:glutathionyl-hydroquinone reductase